MSKKVIEALRNCLKGMSPNDNGVDPLENVPPYPEGEWSTWEVNAKDVHLVLDALATLRAATPKMLTEEEIQGIVDAMNERAEKEGHLDIRNYKDGEIYENAMNRHDGYENGLRDGLRYARDNGYLAPSPDASMLSRDHQSLHAHLVGGGTALFVDLHDNAGILRPPQRGHIGNDPRGEQYASFGGIQCWGGDREEDSFKYECKRMELQWIAFRVTPIVTPAEE